MASLKPADETWWARARAFAGTTTARLALSYLAIIMGMSLGFSVVLYHVSVRELGRPIPPSALFGPDEAGRILRPRQFDDFFADRVAQGRRALLQRLVWVNLLTLVGGGALSYYLARRTLRPIESALEAQSQFVSDASHELRTPLAAMQAENEVALRRKQLPASEARQVLRNNVAEIAKLSSLTDSLLRLARQDAAPATLSAVSLQDVVAQAMQAVVTPAQAKQMNFDDRSAGVTVMAEPAGLVQVAQILFDNAIKYGPMGGTVYVTTETKGRYGLLHVRDEGPGIRPSDQRRIFDRFYRADQSRSSQVVSGHGIGLALAKKIISRYDGEITVTSAPGQGSTFAVKIPLA